MESQQKARENKEKLQEVAREHKKKEKELVKEGKQPFFLKKSEQKKIALVNRFENMKSKQRDKVIERRRKKVTAKERRNMPDEPNSMPTQTANVCNNSRSQSRIPIQPFRKTRLASSSYLLL